jgi:hypothetical protein
VAGRIHVRAAAGGSAFAFAAIADRIDNATLPWLLGAVLAIWFLPGVIPAIVANSLVYRRVRKIVARAEASASSASQVASQLARGSPTSLAAGLLLGGATLLLAASVVAQLRGAWFEHSEGQSDCGAPASSRCNSRSRRMGSGRHPAQLDVDALRSGGHRLRRGEFSSGQWPLAIGTGPIDTGIIRTLHPARAGGRCVTDSVMCIPVDIPAKYLPKECRKN